MSCSPQSCYADERVLALSAYSCCMQCLMDSLMRLLLHLGLQELLPSPVAPSEGSDSDIGASKNVMAWIRGIGTSRDAPEGPSAADSAVSAKVCAHVPNDRVSACCKCCHQKIVKTIMSRLFRGAQGVSTCQWHCIAYAAVERHKAATSSMS